MSAFAVYRLPYGTFATMVQQTDGEPAELSSCAELNGKHGFVMAPFEVTDSHPILLLRPDEVERIDLWNVECGMRNENNLVADSSLQSNLLPHSTLHAPREYSIDFANFHAQLELGTFRKIVLSRCAEEELDEPVSPMELFYRACDLYPRMFISLVSTEKGGCWLTATPEILLEGKGTDWRTIALAGTVRLEGEQLSGEGETVNWSTKNIQEQRYVATYIAECLEQFTSNFSEEGPSSVRAANLVHLRSDFTFTLPSNDHLGDLLQALYPTPAVCGLPKREAFHFITHNEHTPRLYYSGFQGWLGGDETHLYVSLRCMKVEDRCCYLYAGGGLLKDSTLEQEWQETEAKLETMRRCIAIRKM
ncbi:MAG: isochorismate synthase [Prevotella sp.]|nr:isochorismate synthase [Prevotella sp.]